VSVKLKVKGVLKKTRKWENKNVEGEKTSGKMKMMKRKKKRKKRKKRDEKNRKRRKKIEPLRSVG
jgi:hypothetical protein